MKLVFVHIFVKGFDTCVSVFLSLCSAHSRNRTLYSSSLHQMTDGVLHAQHLPNYKQSQSIDGIAIASHVVQCCIDWDEVGSTNTFIRAELTHLVLICEHICRAWTSSFSTILKCDFVLRTRRCRMLSFALIRSRISDSIKSIHRRRCTRQFELDFSTQKFSPFLSTKWVQQTLISDFVWRTWLIKFFRFWANERDYNFSMFASREYRPFIQFSHFFPVKFQTKRKLHVRSICRWNGTITDSC